MEKYPLYFLAFGLTILSGCSREQATPLPDVTDVTPMYTPVGGTVTITGTNFSSSLAANQVSFNGVPATVTAASPTSLTATVPAGAYTAELRAAAIVVTTEGRRSTTPFYLRGDKFPQVLSIQPSSGRVGTVITIQGQNLNPSPALSGVLFARPSGGSPLQNPTSATTTTIQVTVPTGAVTGDLCLYTYVAADKSQYLSDCQQFTVLP